MDDDYSAMFGRDAQHGNANDTMNDTQAQTQAPSEEKQTACVPLFIRHVLSVTGDKPELYYFGREVSIVSIMAILQKVEIHSTRIAYTISDHSGSMRAIWWLDETDKKDKKKIPCVKEGSYVHVHGKYRKPQDEQFIMIMKMVPVDDLDVIVNHRLQVLFVRLAAEKRLENEESEMQNMISNNPGSDLARSMSFMHDDNRGRAPVFTALQEKVTEFVRSFKGKIGPSRDQIKNKFPGYSSNDVDNTLETLVGEGHIFATIDEDHFQTTDNQD